MRSPARHSLLARRGLAVVALVAPLAVTVWAAGSTARAAADDPAVIGIVACDGYADLKKQVRWVGTLVGNPALDAFAESFILAATQFQGLAGLDVGRPAGVVVTAAGDAIGVHGFVPVKDAGKLLAALQGVIGPADKADGGWRIAPPGGAAITIVERDGWAVVSAEGAPAVTLDPVETFAPLVKPFTVGVQIFPARMPAGVRESLRQAAERAAEQAAEQGQPIDAGAIGLALDNLQTTESMLLGFAVDIDNARLYVENRTVMAPDTAAAALWNDTAKTQATVSAGKAAAGTAPAIRAHHAQAVPDGLRAGIEVALAQLAPPDDAEPAARAVFGVVRDLAAAMLDAGGVDASLTVDTSRADDDALLPAITLGVRVKDGAALQAAVKERLGGGGLPPNVKVAFDTGTRGDATLHEITVDLAGLPHADRFGGKVVVTLAVSPGYAFLMTGPGIPGRIDAALAASGTPDPAIKPLAGVDLSLGAALGYAVKLMRLLNPGDPQTDQFAVVADKAAEKPATLVQLLVRPIDRGFATRISVDAGVIETIGTSAAPPPPPLGLPGGPIPGAGAVPGGVLPSLSP